MLEGVVPFPPEYARRYREKGYWQDKSLAQEFDVVFKQYAERVAFVDRGQSYTYADVDRVSTRLALNLLDTGLQPLDRVVLQLEPVYAELLSRYGRLLRHRAQLLRRGLGQGHLGDLLEVFDQQMALVGTRLHRRRLRALTRLQPLAAERSAALASDGRR